MYIKDHRNSKSGFALIELIIGIMIISIALGAFMLAHANLGNMSVKIEVTLRATNLAKSIMGIIRAHNFDENENPPWSTPLGNEEPSPSDFDDVDDYTNYTWPIQPADFPGYSGFSRVFYVNPANSWLDSTGTVTDYKRIIVQIYHDGLEEPLMLSSLITPHLSTGNDNGDDDGDDGDNGDGDDDDGDNGDGDDDDEDDECECQGGIVQLMLRYTGSSGYDIKVYANSGHQDLITTFYNVQSFENLTVYGSGVSGGKLKSKTYFEVVGSGSSDVDIHTSCSQEIFGNSYGNFTVRGHVDKHGNICI